jgi:hypothetical protein
MIRMAEPLAWEVDLEPGCAGRQLRLVPDDVPPPSKVATAATAETPAAASETPADPDVAETLASYLVRLRPGSQCCWCGSTLVEGQVDSRLRLVCGSCGAVVEGPMSVHGGGVRL